MTATPSPWAWTPATPHLWECSVSLMRLTGPDALRVLHGQTSQDLQAARPGDWRSTCTLTPTARLRGLAEVVVGRQQLRSLELRSTGGCSPALPAAADAVVAAVPR